ncbi:Profilin-1 [Caenorhabditis elegans]|uniref:Profilin-1 n=1 Tax=Caenorhabditis elegans TaxID=6239 RepID=PROF1_CAEEL|nr:Profilin-1 [Caenorhabditis elegans]Q9XW16.1 RecName: Full=Profilin-1 [Caenorhabditis elegans]AAT01433.1 profilin-1 [Caenorhabditis elegans]CAA22318.1 Profilin-1 [Caenorhabditis elegans]|eukprot:NP_493258.1 Profilin-1 [Caenorhabditis elegans]
MSGWNAYIDTMTAAAPSIKRCAIVGAADGSVWARTEADNVFKASEEELKTFVALFNDVTQVPAKGADIEGVHYVVPRTEESLIFGKKENTGFFAVKTKSAVLIAVYEGPNEVAAQVRKAVESMQTYLNNAGY